MKSIIIFLFLAGIILIIMGQKQENLAFKRIEYRYIPRTLEQEQLDRVPILSTYGDLFVKSSAWEDSIGYPAVFKNKREEF